MLDFCHLEGDLKGHNELYVLLLVDVCLLDITLYRNNAVASRDLHDLVDVMWYRHKFCHEQPSQDGMICHLEIGHLEDDGLGTVVV